MDYNEQLQKINTAAELGDVSAIEDVKNVIEQDRVKGENMGNAMVLMAAQEALDKFSQKKQDIVSVPAWREDQISRTGGSSEEIQKRTWEINQQLDKAGTQGRINILSAIPESMRTPAQNAELIDLHTKIQEVGIAAQLDTSKLNTGAEILSQTHAAIDSYTDHMSSQIASGASLWDTPSDREDDEPVSFNQPIQPTAEKVDEAHKEYLKSEIESIDAAVSAGFGNEQALDRGIDLEKRLDEYNHPKKTSPQDLFQTLEHAANTLEQGNATPASPEGFGGVIAGLHRDDLGSLYGILKGHGDIDGKTPDQIWAAIKLYMRGASDESHIPESFGLQSKMIEIKKVRDAELELLGITIDKESGAAIVQKSSVDNNPVSVVSPEVVTTTAGEVVPESTPATPETGVGETDIEKSPMVLQKIKEATTPKELEDALRSVRVLHVGNESIETYIPIYMITKYMRADFDVNEIPNIGGIRDKAIELRMGVKPKQVAEVVVPEAAPTPSAVNSLGTINLSPELAQEELEDDDLLESDDMSEEEYDDIENGDDASFETINIPITRIETPASAPLNDTAPAQDLESAPVINEASKEEKMQKILEEWKAELENPTVDIDTYINANTRLTDYGKESARTNKHNEIEGVKQARGAFKYLAGEISAMDFIAPGTGNGFGDGTYGHSYNRDMTPEEAKIYADNEAAGYVALYNKINDKYGKQFEDLKTNTSSIAA